MLVFCVALSCISCTTAESREIASNMAGKTFKGKIEFDYGPDWEVSWKFSEDTVSRKGVEPISLTEANSRIFLRAFSYKAIALSRKIANKSIENLLSVRCKQFTDINK